MTGFGNFIKVFQPEMVTGSTDALEKKDNVLIPVSMAMRMFGSTDVVGKLLFRGKQSDNKPVTIGGVYKDFPENSQIGNYIFMPFDPDIDKNNWGNWNYTCYYRLDNPANVSEVEKLAFQKLMKIAPEELQEGLQEEKDNADFFHLIPLSEVHFSKIGNKSASSRTTGGNADAPQEHQHAEGAGSKDFFPARRTYCGIGTYQPHRLCRIAGAAARRTQFRHTGFGDSRPQPRQAFAFTGGYVRHQHSDWRAGRAVPLILRYVFPSRTGAERFVWPLAQRTEAAHGVGMLPVLRGVHADYRHWHHVHTEPLHPHLGVRL